MILNTRRIVRVKPFLLILAVVVVGCGESKEEQSPESKPAVGTLTARVADGPDSRQWPYLPDEFIPLDKFIVDYGTQLKIYGGKVHLLKLNAETTDIELKHLTGIADVLAEEVELTFSHSQITDAGLKELAKMKNLGSLELDKTQVTDAGVAELQKALPNCDIKYTPAK